MYHETKIVEVEFLGEKVEVDVDVYSSENEEYEFLIDEIDISEVRSLETDQVLYSNDHLIPFNLRNLIEGEL